MFSIFGFKLRWRKNKIQELKCRLFRGLLRWLRWTSTRGSHALNRTIVTTTTTAVGTKDAVRFSGGLAWVAATRFIIGPTQRGMERTCMLIELLYCDCILNHRSCIIGVHLVTGDGNHPALQARDKDALRRDLNERVSLCLKVQQQTALRSGDTANKALWDLECQYS